MGGEIQMLPCAPGPFDGFAASVHDSGDSFGDLFQELSGLPHASDSSNSSDRFSADCEFLLSTAFDLDAALSSLPCPLPALPLPGGACNVLQTAALQAHSGSYSCDRSMQNTRDIASGKTFPSCEPRSFGLLFGPALSTGGTPSMENRPPTSNWHPSSLPPKAVRKGEARLTLNSSVKGAVTKTQRHTATEKVIKPFCIVKSGFRGGGMTLQDLNTSIMEMVARAGPHTMHQPLCPAPGSSLTSWQH